MCDEVQGFSTLASRDLVNCLKLPADCCYLAEDLTLGDAMSISNIYSVYNVIV